MKSVLISIRPKWCELIASGRKTIEVRKTAPKLEKPFKCYIYCTASDVHSCLMVSCGETKLIHCCNYKTAIAFGGEIGNGKIIGEFVCDRIKEYNCEFWGSDDYMAPLHAMEQIRSLDYVDEDDPDWKEYCYVTGNEVENPDDCELCRESCLTYSELRKYIGKGDKTFYGWHISDIKIYNTPKELGEFRKSCPFPAEDCDLFCPYALGEYHGDGINGDVEFIGCGNKLTRPPQSWGYVEEL